MNPFWLVFCISSLIATSEAKEEGNKTTHGKYLKGLLQEYDINQWPDALKKTHTDVSIELFIKAFGSLNAANMDYSIDTFLRQRWRDERLMHPFDRPISVMENKILDKIWKPDTFFENVKEAAIHQVTRPNVLLRIDSDGSILYSLRMKLVLSCGMAFQNFPLDEQLCGVSISSYANTADVIFYSWNEKSVSFDGEKEIAQFDLLKWWTTEYMNNYNTGNFSGLSVHFKLRRQNGYHLLQTYIPTILMVSISWVSFWLDPNAAPGRVSLGVTTLLTLTTLASGIRQQLPPVSYVKAIDVWVGMCMIMVFGALLEFTVVNWLANKKVPPGRTKCPMPRALSCLVREDEEDGGVNKDGQPIPATYRTHARAIDRFCRVFFPGGYLLFNLFYWPYYIIWQQSSENE